MLWEENFTPVIMASCGRNNIRKHKENKSREKYIALDIDLNLDYTDKREANSSRPRDYVGIPGKGLTTYLTLRTKSPNKKQNTRIYITDITYQYFRKLIKKFKNLPDLGCKNKLDHNEPTEEVIFSWFIMIH